MWYIVRVKYLLVFFILLFFGLLQSTVLPVNFLLLLTILFAVNLDLKDGFIMAMISGILRDLFFGLPIGFSSMFFLGMIFLLSLYGRKYKLDHITYLLPFTTISLFAMQVIFRLPINIFNIIFSVFAFLILQPIIRAFLAHFEADRQQLKLME